MKPTRASQYWKWVRAACVLREVQKILPSVGRTFARRTWYSYVQSEYLIPTDKLMHALLSVESLQRGSELEVQAIRRLFNSGPGGAELWKALDGSRRIDQVTSALLQSTTRADEVGQHVQVSLVEGAAPWSRSSALDLISSRLFELSRSIVAFRVRIAIEKYEFTQGKSVLAVRKKNGRTAARLLDREALSLSKLGIDSGKPTVTATKLVKLVKSLSGVLEQCGVDHRDVLWSIQDLVEPRSLPVPFKERKGNATWRELTIGASNPVEDMFFERRLRKRTLSTDEQTQKAVRIVSRMLSGWSTGT